jgi:hypothetical protein
MKHIKDIFRVVLLLTLTACGLWFVAGWTKAIKDARWFVIIIIPLAYSCLSIASLFRRRLAIPLAWITGCIFLLLLLLYKLTAGIAVRQMGVFKGVTTVGVMLCVLVFLVYSARPQQPKRSVTDENNMTDAT